MRLQTSLWLAATLLTLNLIGCGGGSIGTLTPPPSSTPSLTSISLTPSGSTIAAGTPQQFKATGSYSDGSSKDLTNNVTWASSAPSVASISSSGMLSPFAAGQVTVNATLKSVTGSTSVRITDNLVSIEVTGNEVNVNVGSTVQLTAMGTFQDKKPAKVLSGVTWISSAPAIATVSNTGLVTGLAAGSVTIKATLSGIQGSLGLGIDGLILESISIGPSSPAVNVGSQQQLVATGHYNNGSTRNISSSVAWKSSDTTKATISNTGVASGVYHGLTTVTATLGSVSNSAQLTVNAVLNTISITPIGPAVLTGAHQQFSAEGFFNDGSTSDVTASAAWTSSSASIATVAAGKASTFTEGAVNITATQGGVSATTSLDVVNTAYMATLNGSYAMTLTAVDSRGPAMWAGSLNFNGAGSFSGLEDCNTANGIQQNVATAGSYILYPDGRGNIVLNANACHPTGITLRFMFSASGTMASLTEFDGLATSKGTLVPQNPAAFNLASINGTYVFSLRGLDGRVQNPNGPEGIAAIGMFATDGAGNISGGVDDINDYGAVNGQNPLSASVYTMNSNGRGTLQLTDGSGTTNYTVYVVDATRFYFIQTDALPATAVLGIAELQTNQSYANVSGTFSYLIDAPVIVAPNIQQNALRQGQLGDLILTAPTTVSGTLNDDQINGTFLANAGGFNGRGEIDTCGSGQICTQSSDQRTYFYYMVSPAKMLVLQAFWYNSYPQFSPAVGEADLQVQAPYSVSSLAGNYVVQAHDASSFADALMLVNFDGAGDVAGIVDANYIGGMSSTLLNSPQMLLAPTPVGYTVLQLTTPAGTQSYYFYIYSDGAGFLGGVSTPLDGSLSQQ